VGIRKEILLVYRILHPLSADKSLARPGRKKANVSSGWREFPLALYLAGKKN